MVSETPPVTDILSRPIEALILPREEAIKQLAAMTSSVSGVQRNTDEHNRYARSRYGHVMRLRESTIPAATHTLIEREWRTTRRPLVEEAEPTTTTDPADTVLALHILDLLAVLDTTVVTQKTAVVAIAKKTTFLTGNEQTGHAEHPVNFHEVLGRGMGSIAKEEDRWLALSARAFYGQYTDALKQHGYGGEEAAAHFSDAFEAAYKG